MRRINWQVVRQDLLRGFIAWSVIQLFFYSRTYLNYATQLDQKVRWADLWWRAGLEDLTTLAAWTLFTPLILALVRRFPVERGALRRHLPIHAAAALAVSIVDVAINFQVAKHTYFYGPFWPRFAWMTLHYEVFSYAIVAAVGQMLDVYRRYRERDLAAAQLETQLARAHLHALEMQIQPHFLFNTLNSISELVHDDPDAAEVMIAQLGDLLRMTTDRAGRAEVTLAREMELVGTYLEIERTRFQDRLSVRTEVDPDVMDAMVPNLVLQPLVENAVRHGLEASADKVDGVGRLSITARDLGQEHAGRDRHVERLHRARPGDRHDGVAPLAFHSAYHLLEIRDGLR